MTLSWLQHAYVHAHFFRAVIVTRKVGHTVGSLVGLCTQDYKSLCAAVTICATLVNVQTSTHPHTHKHTD